MGTRNERNRGFLCEGRGHDSKGAFSGPFWLLWHDRKKRSKNHIPENMKYRKICISIVKDGHLFCIEGMPVTANASTFEDLLIEVVSTAEQAIKSFKKYEQD